jgi:hypothetical protein
VILVVALEANAHLNPWFVTLAALAITVRYEGL